MSSLNNKGNFDNKKKNKITTINLDITSSSSSSSSRNSRLMKSKEKNCDNNKNESISPVKIKQLFSNSDTDNGKDKNDEEDLTYNFNKALNKKQFMGEKGQMLFKLQNTYGNDSRFKIDSKFKNDINYNKLPSDLKDTKKTELFNYQEIDKEAQDEDIEIEKKKNMSILAELLPNSAFLEHKSLNKPINKLIIKRYDPNLKLGNASVDAIKVDKKKKKEKEKNLVKLEKGVQIFNEKNDMELYNKYNDIDKMKKRAKEKIYNDVINKINDEMNQEIIVNYDSWKKGIMEKRDNNFSLFGDNNNKNNANVNNSENKNTFSLFGDNNKDEGDKNNKKDVTNDDVNKIINNSPKKENNEINDKEMLRKKKKREKQKMKRKEKERIKKEKIKEKREKLKKKMENINKEYEDYLIKEFGEEKANNHLRYIEMIHNFKKNKK